MLSTLFLAVLVSTARAHVTVWAKGMYCKNGLSKVDDQNAWFPAHPVWMLQTKDWFMHGACRSFPPPKGEFLEIPANGKFTVELASNRGVTTLSHNGSKTTDWPDGLIHPPNWSTDIIDPLYPLSRPGCLGSPNIHAHGRADAAGTVFAISYKGKGNINAVTLKDFTVFSVLPNTPYKRLATYSVPNLPACPSGGCLCAWGWVPNHCGLSNMYMNAFRCKVTIAKKTARAVAAPKPPVWCEGNPKACVKGPKQLIAVYQASGNNIVIPPLMLQKDGQRASPGYNMKTGFSPGAQTDIFVKAPATKSSSAKAASTAASRAARSVEDVPSNSTSTVPTPSNKSTMHRRHHVGHSNSHRL